MSIAGSMAHHQLEHNFTGSCLAWSCSCVESGDDGSGHLQRHYWLSMVGNDPGCSTKLPTEPPVEKLFQLTHPTWLGS